MFLAEPGSFAFNPCPVATLTNGFSIGVQTRTAIKFLIGKPCVTDSRSSLLKPCDGMALGDDGICNMDDNLTDSLAR